MPRMGKSWTVKVRGRKHAVVVKRKPWLAIGVVEVDGERVGMFPAKALSMGISFFPNPEVHFEVSDVACVLKVQPGMFTYGYELYVDEKLVEPEVV